MNRLKDAIARVKPKKREVNTGQTQKCISALVELPWNGARVLVSHTAI